jgi:hypothetical protein
LSLSSRIRLGVLLLAGPVLGLVASDLALTRWHAHWAWVAREVPPFVLDPYRLEGLLRTTAPGRANVVLLGNSITEAGFDAGALEQRFASRGLRFPKLTIGGAPALSFGMLADAIADLEPTLAVLVVSPPSLRSRGYEDHVFAYDARAIPALFTARELLASPRFHIDGAAAQLHVLARHRRALQRAGLVALGRLDWETLARAAARLRRQHMLDGADQLQSWMADREPDVYPNPNTRALGWLAGRLRARGARLAVLEAPLHPVQSLLLPRERVARAHEELARLAASEGFTLLERTRLPALGEEDFADWVHANARGRERLTAFLADYLAETL